MTSTPEPRPADDGSGPGVTGRRVALVSGGGRGIGRAVGRALAAAGLDVAVNFRRDERAAADTVTALTALGVTARAYRADVSQPGAVDDLVASVLADFGRVDVLVHSAGVASRGKNVVETEPDELRRLFDTHAAAAHHLSRAVIPGMRTRGRGDIVFISSIVASSPLPMMAPYVMAKAALESLGQVLAREERVHGIRVNSVAPGLVATEMGDRLVRATRGVECATDLDAVSPFGRVCRPEDIAATVAFLTTPVVGSYITGQCIAVDGGERWLGAAVS
jgi:NAD(P)-dependent dehydrogenase (short-subunit alcohol dehydrogenase family)